MTELKQTRLDLNITQVELAKRVGVSLTSYVLWERGVTTPSPENFIKLNHVLREIADEQI